MENNKRIAQLFRQMAALLDEQNVAFKPAAYRRAAQVVEEMEQDVSKMADKKTLMGYSGIGEATASKILEYLETGRIAHLDKLLAEQGGISPELMAIEDLGPKRARQLQKELGINTVAQLIKAAEDGKLRSMPRFSEIMEAKILENAKNVTEHSKRHVRSEVKKDVEKILATLRKVPGVERAEAAGSYRREKESIGDLDILVAADAKKIEELSEAVAALPMVRHVVAHGGTKLSFDLTSGLRTDVRFVTLNQWGSAILYFTGSKDHNIVLRRRAIDKGWKLNEYGLFDGERLIASKEEEDIYRSLGLPFIDPKNRTADIASTGTDDLPF